MVLPDWNNGQAGGTPLSAENLDAVNDEIRARVRRDEVGALGGVAPLDTLGRVPAGMLPDRATSRYQPLYDRIRARASVREKRVGNVVFLGSSTMAGHNIERAGWMSNRIMRALQNTYTTAYGFRNPPMAANLGDAERDAWANAWGLRGHNGANGGTDAGNYVSADGITRVKALDPIVVFHMIGSNDYFLQRPLETYRANLLAAANAIRPASGLQPVQVFIHQFPRRDVTNPGIPWAEYGRIMREVADTSPDYMFIDASLPFLELGFPAVDTYGYMMSDQIHITEAGHGLMADVVIDALGLVPITDSGWRPVTFLNTAYASRPGGFDLQYRVVGREVKLRGGVAMAAGGALTAGQVSFGSVPAQFAPGQQATQVAQVSTSGQTCMVWITPAGVLVYWIVTAGPSYVMFNNVSWFLDD